jgi:hypothetical protein
MELNALLFSLGLLLAGIWLIFTISGDFREKKRLEQRAAEPPRRHPHAARYVPPVAQPSAANHSRQSSTPTRTDAPIAAPKVAEKKEPVDPFQDLSVSVIHETFERFNRKP